MIIIYTLKIPFSKNGWYDGDFVVELTSDEPNLEFLFDKISVNDIMVNKYIWLHKLPTQVFFNEKKKATTLLFNDKPYVVKCDSKDKYDKRIGFLEAYFQAQSGLSKTQANKYLRDIVKEDD